MALNRSADYYCILYRRLSIGIPIAPFQHTKLVKAIFVEGLRLAISAKIIFNFQSLSKPGSRPPCYRDEAHLSYFVESILGNITANVYSILVTSYRGDN